MPSSIAAKTAPAGRPAVTAQDLVATTKALTAALADVERLQRLVEQHQAHVPPLDETPYLEAQRRHADALADLAEGAGSQDAVDQAAVDLAESEAPVLEARQTQQQFQAMATALRPRLAAAEAAAEAAQAAHRVALERHIIDQVTAARSAYQAAAEALRDAHTRLRGLQHLARQTVNREAVFVEYDDDRLYVPPLKEPRKAFDPRQEFYSTAHAEITDRFEGAADAIRKTLTDMGVAL